MKNKLIILFALFVSHLSLFAQGNSGTISGGPGAPPDPQTEADGIGATATSPIDMYVYVLAIVAVLAITYFAKKYKTQKI
ncbi:MAG: signal peptidase [Chryseobacterium sp.]|uniref:signal peptidase n=1 Tax=Chryseobacterium sp. TaxID=1871047 RepID=UPI001B29AEBC|nr:signal peptidase [Chryseobacterium sp.]MBO6184284.1 signal peptidase [Chryseobacterium sp.]